MVQRRITDFFAKLIGLKRDLPDWTLIDENGEKHRFAKKPWRVFLTRSRKLWSIAAVVTMCAGNAFAFGKYSGQPVEVLNDMPDQSAFGEQLVAEPHFEIGLIFPYGFINQIASVTYTGSASSRAANSMQYCATNTSANSKCEFHSREYAAYLPGQGMSFLGTAVMTTGVDTSSQIFGAVTPDLQDGYGWGYNGADFGIVRFDNGTAVWVASGAFNIDKLNGSGPSGMTIDPTKGNVYKIQAQWLGFGSITWFVEEPISGHFVPAHSVRYPNANTTPSSRNPSLPISYVAQNYANTSNIEIGMASSAIYQEGRENEVYTNFSTFTIQNVGTTEIPIISLRSTATFKGITSRVFSHITHLSVINDNTTKSAVIRIYKNGTLTAASFVQNNDDTDSTIDVDEDASAYSGGRIIFPLAVSNGAPINEHIEELDITIEPGETVTITGQFASGSGDITLGLRWREIH